MLRHTIKAVTTAGDGSATEYTAKVYGKLEHIAYIKTDFADGSTITITNETSGESLWMEVAVNASAVRRPRAPTHSQAGVAALYAGGGIAVLDRIAIAGSRIKIVIANGGDSKIGTFHFVTAD